MSNSHLVEYHCVEFSLHWSIEDSIWQNKIVISFLGLRQIEFHLVLYLQSTSNAGQEYGETCSSNAMQSKIVRSLDFLFYRRGSAIRILLGALLTVSK